GVVTASALRYRAAPDTSSAVLGLYPRGTDLTLLCQTHGTSVLGVDTWYRTADGFVSGRYVSLTGAGTLAAC
ncbi:SH3 domain-containing protein, partial [Desulfosarcina cetonica]|uniref:SH3 domain-containing protein n=1 Tax=Desulfosarcina cetonica TaxID=90730 RepID=UPI0012EDF9ED